jgi:hypothetical protein
MIPGPLTRTSPTVPVGTSTPCSSSTATCTPCTGGPTDPGFLRPKGRGHGIRPRLRGAALLGDRHPGEPLERIQEPGGHTVADAER